MNASTGLFITVMTVTVCYVITLLFSVNKKQYQKVGRGGTGIQVGRNYEQTGDNVNGCCNDVDIKVSGNYKQKGTNKGNVKIDVKGDHVSY